MSFPGIPADAFPQVDFATGKPLTEEELARKRTVGFRALPDPTGIQSHLSGLSPLDKVPQLSNLPVREIGANTGIKSDGGVIDTSLDFLSSMVSAGTKELVGFEASRETEKFRAAHPTLGMASEVLGFLGPSLIPYIGQSAFGLGIVGLGARGRKAISAAEGIEGVFARSAALEGLRWAPFEAARLGTSVALSPFGAQPGEIVKSVALELPFIAGAGGAIGFLGSRLGGATQALARTSEEFKLNELVPGYNLNWPRQEKIRHLTAWKQTDDGAANSELVDTVLEPLRGAAEVETLASVARYHGQNAAKTHVGRVVEKFGGDPSSAATRRIENLFRGIKGIIPRRFVTGADDGYSATGLAEVKAIRGEIFPENHQAFTQFPRELETTQQGRAHLFGTLERDFNKYGDDLWLAKEVETDLTGNYIGVIRYRPPPTVEQVGSVRALTEAKPDRFFLFKTSEPQQFAPGVDSLQEAAANTFVRTRNWKFPGLPTTDDEAKALALKLKEQGAEGWVDADVTDPEIFRQLLTRGPQTSAAAKRAMKTAMFADDRFSGIDASIQGMANTAPKRKVTPGGSIQTENKFVAWLDNRLPEQARLKRQASAKIMQDYGFTLKGSFAPASVEFNRSARAQSWWAAAQDTFGEARSRALEQGWGTPTALKAGEGLVGRIIKGTETKGGLIPKVREAFDAGGGEEFWNAWLQAWSPDEAAANGARKSVVDALKALDFVDSANIAELSTTRAAFGMVDDFTPLKNHYLISRTWVGDWRLPIYTENGNIIAYASGRSAKDTVREAQAIIADVNERIAKGQVAGHPTENAVKLKEFSGGLKAEAGKLTPEEHMFSQVENLTPAEQAMGIERGAYQTDVFQLAKNVATGDPLFKEAVAARARFITGDPARFRQRTGQGGFLGQSKAFGFKDAKERIIGNLVETHRLLAKESVLGRGGEQMMRLMAEDKGAGARVIQRFNSLSGIQGPVNRAINRGFDNVLASTFGTRAVPRFVRKLNEVMYFSTLGALDAGFVAVNAMTPIQTVFPEIMFTARTPRHRLMHYYSFELLPGPDGKVRPFGFVDGMKVMKQGFRDMINPDKELAAAVNKATKDGTISRAMVEEVFGKDSKTAKAMLEGKLLDPEEGFFKNLLNVMQAPAAMSEEFSRGYSFIVGYRMAKDFLGHNPDQAAAFARQFTLRTNFGYGTAERPKIITGAVGSGFGLFKNWTMNYTTNLMAYGGEAAKGNFAPVLGAMMGTGAVGGIAAVPGFGVATGMSKFLTDKNLMDYTYELLGNGPGEKDRTWTADLLMYGAPSLLGVSLQGRAAAPGASALRDAQMMFNSVHTQRGQALADLLGGAFTAGSKGINPYDSPSVVRDLIRTFAPRTLQRAYAGVSQDGLRSLHTGNRVMPGPDGLKALLFTLGITPLEIEKQLDSHNELYDNTERLKNKIGFYGELMEDAIARGDTKAMVEIRRRTIGDDVPLDSVVRSAVTRRSLKEDDQINRQWDLVQTLRLKQTRGLK